jgi:hypothetical protein
VKQPSVAGERIGESFKPESQGPTRRQFYPDELFHEVGVGQELPGLNSQSPDGRN